MFSRCSLPKNYEKYQKTVNCLKEKWNIKRQNNIKFIKKYVPTVTIMAEKVSNINNKINVNTSSHVVKLRQILKSCNLRDKMLLSTAGYTIIETKGNQVTSTTTTTIPTASTTPPLITDPIPEPPTIPTTETIESITNVTGEVPFESLGLGGWTPVGIVQNCLEYLHMSLDIPWWGAIVIGTIVVRALMFPLVIVAQRNGAKMNNYLPQLQVLQLKMTEARQTGNQLDAARYGQEMMTFMKEKNLNPLKNLIVPLAQMPLFISFFVGLRQMANCPVNSMQHGGLFWFSDLTLPDQYFILPVITSLTMWATIEVGTDSAKLSAQNMQTMKYVLRAMPVVILPFTVNFPGAILCYWVCTNFISLLQVGFLRIPKVRDYFKIEQLVSHSPDNLPIKPKGFVSGMKESWTNMKITSEIEGRKQYDAMQFQRAGKGPIVKTYKFDPTKQNVSAMSTTTTTTTTKKSS